MKTELKRFFADFNNYSFGMADAVPKFIIEPEAFDTADGTGCFIAQAAAVTVRIELALMEAAFAAVLDRKGRLKQSVPAVFRTEGTVYLHELDESHRPTGRIFRILHAKLQDNVRYEYIPGRGQRLILNLTVTEPENGNYITLVK